MPLPIGPGIDLSDRGKHPYREHTCETLPAFGIHMLTVGETFRREIQLSTEIQQPRLTTRHEVLDDRIHLPGPALRHGEEHEGQPLGLGVIGDSPQLIEREKALARHDGRRAPPR